MRHPTGLSLACAFTFALVFVFACSESEPARPAVDAAADRGGSRLDAAADAAGLDAHPPGAAPDADHDARLPDAAAPNAAPDAATPDGLPADTYCERAVDVFCPYYVRCGRMAVADLDACRRVFVESCNAKYEPIYAAHAAAGELALSRAGLAACGAHLAAVDCAAHDFDLDGPCGAVWPGQVGAGGVCGPGIGSFVCAAGTTCRLDIQTFCGTCEPAVAPGGACGDDARCDDDGECHDGNCARRPTAGEPCRDDGPRCATGSSCQGGACTIRPWAAPGEACGQAARCRYKSECVGGICVEGALIGAACDAARPCATGWCDGGVCAAPRSGGAACASGAACVSGGCAGGVCLDARGPCFLR